MSKLIAEVLHAGETALSNTSESPRLDSEILLCHLLNKDRAFLMGWSDMPLADDQIRAHMELVRKRMDGTPVAYITGHREFYSLNFIVNEHTLIPRPETELLVERTLERISPEKPWAVADLGTGCGAVAIAIAHERGLARVTATDISRRALAVAKRNAKALHINNIEFAHGDWFSAIKNRRFMIIVSNPPYVAEDDPALGMGDVRSEPKTALVSGRLGLDALSEIALFAPRHLYAGGWLLVEHGPDQHKPLAELLTEHGFEHIHCYRDHSNHERVTEAQWPEAPG